MAVKLYYFDGRGLCEPIRWVLSHNGVQFEDIRAPIEKFPPPLPAEIKSKCRWGQVPLIEFEGKNLTQSLAICRYFAKKGNLVPKDDYEAALCDEYVDACRDMMTSLYGVVMENDEQKKKEKLQEVTGTVKTRFLNVFDSIIKANGGKYLVGTSMTWADIWLAHILNHFEILLGVKLYAEHASLKALMDTVMNTQGIKQWLEKRPNTKL